MLAHFGQGTSNRPGTSAGDYFVCMLCEPTAVSNPTVQVEIRALFVMYVPVQVVGSHARGANINFPENNRLWDEGLESPKEGKR